jgi:hypothetical protein
MWPSTGDGFISLKIIFPITNTTQSTISAMFDLPVRYDASNPIHQKLLASNLFPKPCSPAPL